jgi:GNAT superfamily N-acetyltransferase
MDVVPLSLSSPPEQLAGWHRIDRLVHGEMLEGLESVGERESRAELDSDLAHQRRGLLAVEGDEPVGAFVWEESTLEDLDTAGGWIVVDPTWRKRGVATALLAEGREQLRAAGRTRLMSSVRIGSPGDAYAGRIAAREVQVELCNVLDVASAPRDLLDGADSPAPGYLLHTWVDTCPTALVPAFARAQSAMDDAPLGEEPRDDACWTPERVRDMESRRVRNDVRCYTAAAVHEQSGAVAGFTEIAIVDRPATAIQENTGVVRAHRGHGLGLLVKTANLRAVVHTEPQVRWVVTWNAESNRHMLAVNERLGFRVHSRWQEIALDL